MASPFKHIQVYLQPNNWRVITWQISPNMSIPSTATVTILYARAGGLWLTLTNSLPLAHCYIDKRTMNHDKYNNDFYRLKLIAGEGLANTYTSDPQKAGVNLSYPYFSKAKNLIRLGLLEMDKTGRHGFLMKKIVFGDPCPVCKLFDNDGPVNLHCPICLGTGIKGGYYKAIPMNILLEHDASMLALEETGTNKLSILMAKCTAWPIIQLGDIWVDLFNNERYYILNAAVVSKYQHVPLLYRLRMHLLELSDVMHSLLANALITSAYIGGNSDWTKEFELL